jgi:hypothetical protein
VLPPAPRQRTDAGLDELNQELLDAINATGEVFLPHTRLNGAVALRLAMGHRQTRKPTSRASECSSSNSSAA